MEESSITNVNEFEENEEIAGVESSETTMLGQDESTWSPTPW